MLAGQLKISEAVPSLVNWIDQSQVNGPTATTRAEYRRLETFPSAKALAQIGDPSVPAVSKVLDEGNTHERYVAVYVLNQVHSDGAMQVLAAHSSVESDPGKKT
jgi:hypothetical protein